MTPGVQRSPRVTFFGATIRCSSYSGQPAFHNVMPTGQGVSFDEALNIARSNCFERVFESIAYQAAFWSAGQTLFARGYIRLRRLSIDFSILVIASRSLGKAFLNVVAAVTSRINLTRSLHPGFATIPPKSGDGCCFPSPTRGRLRAATI